MEEVIFLEGTLGREMRQGDELNNERIARLEKASLDAAHEGLKALLLLNGGACVAVLGFLATTVKDAQVRNLDALVPGMLHSLIGFSLGAGLAVFTSLLSYLSNQAYVSAMLDPRVPWGRGNKYSSLGICVALLSFCAFGYGVYSIAKAIPF